ncbi:MAG: cob(I)yrinic acid a,c-diamide adenosyltransferase [Eubacteriaceae bacterium]|nr:cob(I)yrinic acid a,c-diamide adenosyltransferase [Eubacteriaceae bacterium]
MDEVKGLIHFYFGYGKGKTTAAMGLALRACGYGRKVVIVQFLKNTQSGEILHFSGMDSVTILRGTAASRFFEDMTQEEKDETALIQEKNLEKAIALVNEGSCDMLILDEAVDAYQMGLLNAELFEDFVKNKPAGLELVITGHKRENWLIKQADYVTEMVKLKHPYEQGIKARKGIEY